MRNLFLFFLIFFILLSMPIWSCRIIPTPPIVIVPEPQPRLEAIQVRKHNVEITIQDGVATTILESVFYNPNPRQLEGTYLFPLPAGASVSQFSMWIDGKEMQGELLDATKARDLYISIVRRMIDPGLLEFVGRDTFQMRIFPIPAQGEKRVKLSYQQLLKEEDGLSTYVYPLTTVGNGREDVLGEVSIKVDIQSQIPLKSIFSSSHEIKVNKEENKARITFEATRLNPNKDFTLYISRSEQKIGLTLVPYHKGNDAGYFLLSLAPKVNMELNDQYSKDVVFVFDTSGSMISKNKIEQAKEALKYCLSSLRPNDKFNIVTFATKVTLYEKNNNLLDASKENIKAALNFVDNKVVATGGTNIDGALATALKLAPQNSKRPFMIFFLTDGEPTIGPSDPNEIINNVKKANIGNLRLFSFGVGAKLNTKLLDMLSEQNRGDREYVDIEENIEVKVSRLFDKVSSPVLNDIQIEFPKLEKIKITEIYPKNFGDLFKGGQLTVVGRYTGSGDQAIRISGLVGEEKQEFDYEVTFPENNTENNQIPRLWAVRKVGFLLDQIRLEGESSGLRDEVVKLAEEFGIVTPYTSYLVLEDDPRITGGAQRAIEDARPRFLQPSSPAPAGNAWREKAQSAPAVSEEMEQAKSAMTHSSGEHAVEASRALKAMKDAQVADSIDKKESEGKGKSDKEWLRKIDEKTFYLRDGIWYDSTYNGKDTKVKIRYMSNEYFDLIKKKSGIGKFLALGEKVIIVFENTVYEIY